MQQEPRSRKRSIDKPLEPPPKASFKEKQEILLRKNITVSSLSLLYRRPKPERNHDQTDEKDLGDEFFIMHMQSSSSLAVTAIKGTMRHENYI